MDQVQKLRQKGNLTENINDVGNNSNNNNNTDSFKSIDGDLIREQVKINIFLFSYIFLGLSELSYSFK